MVANSPFDIGLASSGGGGGGTGALTTTRGARGTDGARTDFGFDLEAALALDAELAAVFRAAALRAGDDGFARPERPSR